MSACSTFSRLPYMEASNSFLRPASALTSFSFKANSAKLFFICVTSSSERGRGKNSFFATLSFCSCFFFFCFRTNSGSGSEVAFESLAAAKPSASPFAAATLSPSLVVASSPVSFADAFALEAAVLVRFVPPVLFFFSVVAFTHRNSSTVTVGFLSSTIPLNSRGTVAETFGMPVKLYSFHLPCMRSDRPVTSYSVIRTPSSNTRTEKSSSAEKASFFFPPRAAPAGYKMVTFLSHAPLNAAIWTEYSCCVMSEKKIFRTRKEVLAFAAIKAAPRAAASSPFKCCPKGTRSPIASSRYFEIISCTFGTRQAPPTTSTCVRFLSDTLAFTRAFSMGSVRMANMSAHITSNSSRWIVA
mmetsp:Transcript_18392/g.52726  ORF Transcript_18392/g.52726 Transcript_18392/m.52726 type:complete len:356 (+) Transcript_18392:822-1889(+)